MRKRTWVAAAFAALAIAAVAAPAAQARSFEGKIVAHNAKAKTFKIREYEGGGTFKVRSTATPSTRGSPASRRSGSAGPTWR